MRVVRAVSILLLAIAAAGLPWYFVTRSSDTPTRPSGATTTSTRSPSPSATASLRAGTFEVFGVEACANLRAEPSTSAKRLTCLTPGIQLESDGQTQQAEGRLWRHVTYERDNLTGWMADQYLKPV